MTSDEKPLLCDRPELQESCDKWASLFSEADTVQKSIWQENLVIVAKSIDECLNNCKVSAAAAGPSHGGQASD